VPILRTVSRNKQAKIVSNVHGLAEGNPRLALQFYERLGARNMTASWCESACRSEEHFMLSSIESIDREMGR
jgi:hypothetical protein